MTLQWAQWLPKSDPTKSQCSWSKLCLVFTWNLKKNQSGCTFLLNWGRLLEFPDLIEVHFLTGFIEGLISVLNIICTAVMACISPITWSAPHAFVNPMGSAHFGELRMENFFPSNYISPYTQKMRATVFVIIWVGFVGLMPLGKYFCVQWARFLFLCIFLGSVYQTVYLCWQLQRGQGSRKCSGAFIWSSLWSLLPTFRVTMSGAR